MYQCLRMTNFFSSIKVNRTSCYITTADSLVLSDLQDEEITIQVVEKLFWFDVRLE
jgi:hypothetical protein